MDSQTRSLDPGDRLQLYLASLREEFRSALVASLRRSDNAKEDALVDAAPAIAAFEFVVDGSRRGQLFRRTESSRTR
jgi:hypothetical protein